MVSAIFAGALAGGSVNILIRAQDQFSKEFKKAKKETKNLSTSFNRGILSAGLYGAAIGAVGGFFLDAAKSGIKFNSMLIGFERLAGETSDKLLRDLKVATSGMVSQMDLVSQANQALLLGIDQEALPNMFKAASRIAIAQGRPVSAAIADITTGIGRQSRLVLDNLGIIVKADEANEKYAISIGKVASELTTAERKIAFTNAAIEALNESSEKLGDITESTAGSMQRLNSLFVDFKNAVGTELAIGIDDAFRLFDALGFVVEEASKKMDIQTEAIQAQDDQLIIIGGRVISLRNEYQILGNTLGIVTTNFVTYVEQIKKAKTETTKLTTETKELNEEMSEELKIFANIHKAAGTLTFSEFALAEAIAEGDNALAEQIQTQLDEQEVLENLGSQLATMLGIELEGIGITREGNVVRSLLRKELEKYGFELDKIIEGQSKLNAGLKEEIRLQDSLLLRRSRRRGRARGREFRREKAFRTRMDAAIVAAGLDPDTATPEQIDMADVSIPIPGGFIGFQAHGGIVTRPSLAVVGEAGPEAIIPLNKAGMMGVTIIVNGDVSGEELVDKVSSEITSRLSQQIAF